MTSSGPNQLSNAGIASHSEDPQLSVAIDAACERIAPTWPLDQFIAVNPWWGYVDQPIAQAGAMLAATSGARMLMPRGWYREAFAAGSYAQRHVGLAIERAGSELIVQEVIAALDHWQIGRAHV